jgi:hypothetical protein
MFIKKSCTELGAMAHTCNLSYLEGRNQEDHGLRPAQAKIWLQFEASLAKKVRHYLKNNLRHNSSKTLSLNPITTPKKNWSQEL